jgi:hypothetical protein
MNREIMDPKPKEPIPAACIPRDIMLQAAMIRLGNVGEEIQAGYNILRKYHKTVTIFGSARKKKIIAIIRMQLPSQNVLRKKGTLW